MATVSCAIIIQLSFAQDTLPNFTAKPIGVSKAQISWQNPYPNCTQISVQKSYDSLRFFKTIFSPLSPELPINGFVDNDYLPQMKTWYRIQYVLEDGSFYFTKSKIPGQKSFEKRKSILIVNEEENTVDVNTTVPSKSKADIAPPKEEVLIKIFKQNLDSLKYELTENRFKLFKDSLTTKTKDTLFALAKEYYIWKPFIPIPQWKPSLHIYTNSNGMVNFDFPKYKQHYYKVIIYNETGKEILRIKQVKTDLLILEKGNFVSAGWFTFDIYEDDKLKEKNKFYLNKDF